LLAVNGTRRTAFNASEDIRNFAERGELVCIRYPRVMRSKNPLPKIPSTLDIG
jgi:hypothetical protein